MKTSTKIAIGLSTTLVAGVVTSVIVADKIMTKVKKVSNRKKVKRFVDDKLNGNAVLSDMVDRLSDKDIESLVNIGRKIEEGQQQVAAYGASVKKATNGAKTKVSQVVQQLKK
ncbi:hypothetical protein [Enterococcus columbae]|uniref:Uncharacterized protein n=1 Tax=Enterococcus columbae DSM 7374 = ATCC 51263 TaxID=1121865 RepID=S0KRV8_9ENTE|nr:hypothetical protein [Enterococcus columbae]EOT41976.1 hypothetical protein OMW_01090 [Enterococcus columbae DSM 7374 = ATCC 51263]EOW80533.1 hypothetical protein I568_01710 [Enterococcus columbae DSM 7374 = ATCC 51263]OJG26392.1 hypothetical protein RR47_GL000140 [Enterococcus columbae DSM 7374 = ATCC 51263]